MYAHENPFASHKIDGLKFRLSGMNWGRLFEKLHSFDNRCSVVGPHGNGKTTFLDAFESELKMRGHDVVRLLLNDATPRLPETLTIGSGMFVILDGAERLSWPAWQSFLWNGRRAQGFVITRHKPCRLPVLYSCSTSLPLLDELLLELWPEVPSQLRREAHDLYHRHDGNLRLVFRGLYDRCGALC
jgi:hypothetical protein